MRTIQLRRIFEKTDGHCHFCGDPIEFEKRGWAEDLSGYWAVDHVIQRHKGGLDGTENFLPACTRCNRLRWHRSGEDIRELLLLGSVAQDQIRRQTWIGERLVELRDRRLELNRRRRRK